MTSVINEAPVAIAVAILTGMTAGCGAGPLEETAAMIAFTGSPMVISDSSWLSRTLWTRLTITDALGNDVTFALQSVLHWSDSDTTVATLETFPCLGGLSCLSNPPLTAVVHVRRNGTARITASVGPASGSLDITVNIPGNGNI